jgi:glycosyltransferase involved in cell wall biosynthesis
MLGWELPPHNSGGLGVACYFLSKALSRQGVDIDFVVPYLAKHKIKHMQVLSALHIEPLYKYGFGAYDSKYIDEVIFDKIKQKDLVTIRDVQKYYIKFVDGYIAKNKPDIVHVHDWLTLEAGMMARKKYGLPLVAHVHATEFDRSGDQGGNSIEHEIEYNGLLAADRIIAVSQSTKDLIFRRYSIPADKIEVVYNGFDALVYGDDYQYNQAACLYLEQLKRQGYTVVSTVARLTIQKGLTHMLQAAAKAVRRYDKLVFLFVGDGEQRDELIHLAAEYGILEHVIFTGFMRGRQLRDIYTLSDIFVMSSVSEPFGLTALEAAHHDNALIITRQSGVKEILRNIFFYDFWDTDKLADQIVGVAMSTSLRENLQQNVKTEYAKISWEDVAKKCEAVYNKMVSHKRKHQSWAQ